MFEPITQLMGGVLPLESARLNGALVGPSGLPGPFGTQEPTQIALPGRFESTITAMEIGKGPLAPTTEVSQPVTETTATLDEYSESGERGFEVDNYDKVGGFDFSSLRVDAIPSGFAIFDRHFVLKKHKAQLVTVAAYTSHGKTALMMQLAANVSRYGPVFVHSFEMSKTELETRLLAGIANYPAEKIMRGEIPKDRLTKAVKDYSGRQLYLCKSTNNTLPYIQTSCFEKAKQVGQPSLIVVDYLQLMSSGTGKVSRTWEISECMKGLKTLAEQMQCPVLLGSQLNRECEKRGKAIEQRKGVGEYRPIISDLAESSAIAHDSDVVLFITRQEQYDGTRHNQADIICAKNRSGQTFDALFQWSGETCSFFETQGRGGEGSRDYL